MKKQYLLLCSILASSLIFIAVSCGTDDNSNYERISPVTLDLNAAPYDSLSKYKFFEGEMKNLEPSYMVLPYDLNTSLFTDYALKKRFIWMPKGVRAAYTEDDQVPDFPTGTVLIKNFYYDNTVPSGETTIIETRLMIKKAEGWIFATYVWNSDQTEAILDNDGEIKRVAWNQGGTTRNIMYQVPKATECYMCHQRNDIPTPIGTKPQNINKMYAYADGSENQLSRWVKAGYLAGGYPSAITSTIDWEDESQPPGLRVRSYLDANCAHCHTDGGQCDHTPMDLAFSQTINPANLGICVEPQDFVSGGQTHIIAPQDVAMSLMYFRMSNNEPLEMMPLLGRTVVHDEALLLMEEWINSLQGPCP